MRPAKVLSLFDGISCGMVALERAGIPVERYDAYEIDENAIRISEYNYPSINHNGDVFDAKYDIKYDLLIGGSPCTYWSVARGGNDRGRETTPSGIGYDLFMQYVRALKEANPRYFLYENNSSIAPAIKDAISKELGVHPISINSSLLSAQNRNRCYWTNISFDYPNDKNIMLDDVIDFKNEEFRPIGKWVFSRWGDKIKLDTLYDIHAKKSNTLTTQKSHPRNYYLSEDKTQYCNLTVRDWEKLQTLPEGYVDSVPNISQGAKYKAIGNGWTVDVIAHILKELGEEKNG